MNAESEDHIDIEERILRVEQRLMAREDRLRSGLASLGGQLRQRFQPKKLLLPVGGGLFAAAALLVLWRRPAPAAPLVTPPAARAPIPWVRLLGLAWPLLPLRWRERVSPVAATGFMSLGLPIIETLLRPRFTEPLQTVAEVDLARLAGRWFIVGELPALHDVEPQQPPELGLLPRDDGRFDLLQRRIDRSGPHGSEALVEPVAGSHGSRLRINPGPEALRWLPLTWTEHGVLHVDAAYDEALLGSTGRDTLWLLSRQPMLTEERRQALVQIARDRGFAVDKLQFFA